MLHPIPTAARVSVPPSRAGPRMIRFSSLMLALSAFASQNAMGQGTQLIASAPPHADSGKSTGDSTASVTTTAAALKLKRPGNRWDVFDGGTIAGTVLRY